MDLGLLHSFLSVRVKQPLVVFQSDDWGFDRLGTLDAFNEFQKRSIMALKGGMATKDFLETEEDVSLLREVLTERGVRHLGDNPAVFTCNAVMANAHWDKIRYGGEGEFVAENVVDSYQRLHGNVDGFHALKDGVSDGSIDLQFHAWVHLQYGAWQKAYNEGDRAVTMGTELGICGVESTWAKTRMGRSNFLAALDWQCKDEGYISMLNAWKRAFLDFESVWGVKPTSFIAPAYIWNKQIERELGALGLQSVQGLPYQLIPIGRGNFKRKYRRMRFNPHGILYTLRNCYFEPGEDYSKDYVAPCLKRMESLIGWGVPVIINTHRFNYMGGFDPDHRSHGLRELDRLLGAIRKQWPDVRFIGTRELTTILSEKSAEI